MITILGSSFRSMLARRGLVIEPDSREERYLLKLDQGDIAIYRHPALVRDALIIAAAVYAEGEGEHAEMCGLYARREELDCPSPEPRVIEWLPHSAAEPGLNPGKWVRLDVWLDDQFLFEDAIKLRYDRISV